MKKTALFLALVLLFAITGCQKQQPTMDDAWDVAMDIVNHGAEKMEAEIQRQEDVAKRQEEERKTDFFSNQTPVVVAPISDPDEASILVKSYGIYEEDDNTVITFTADYTNLHSQIDLALGSVFPNAYQNGVKLNSIFGEFDKDVYTAIKTGTTLEVSFSYVLRDTGSAVDLEFSSFDLRYDGTDVNSTCTIPLQ